MKTDIIVIGAGPVGLFTVFEAGILGLNCILIDNLDKPGGQCAELYPDKPIYDIPGVPYQTGQEHVDALLKQIEPFNYKLLLNQRVNEITKNGNNWIVKTSSMRKLLLQIYLLQQVPDHLSLSNQISHLIILLLRIKKSFTL